MLAKTGSPRSEGWMVAADRALSGCGFHRAPFDEGKQVWFPGVGVGGAHAGGKPFEAFGRPLLKKLHKKKSQTEICHFLIIPPGNEGRRPVPAPLWRRGAVPPP